jgi:hypothetical protein
MLTLNIIKKLKTLQLAWRVAATRYRSWFCKGTVPAVGNHLLRWRGRKSLEQNVPHRRS